MSKPTPPRSASSSPAAASPRSRPSSPCARSPASASPSSCWPRPANSSSASPRCSRRSAARPRRACRSTACRSRRDPAPRRARRRRRRRARRSAPPTAGELGYDRLIVAPGARAVEGVPGAMTFRGPISAGAVEGALRARARTRAVRAPAGLRLAAADLRARAARRTRVPGRPRDRGRDPRAAPARRLRAGRLRRARAAARPRRRRVHRRHARGGGRRRRARHRRPAADRGRRGHRAAPPARPAYRRACRPMPHGFLEVDAHARVIGVPDVFAAGDATAEPVKQGGLATQQADAAAEAIAAEAGAPIDPRPCRRVLRGVVLTGEEPLFLRRDLDDDSGARPAVARRASRRLPRPAVVAVGQDRRPLPDRLPGLRRRAGRDGSPTARRSCRAATPQT